ncbi:hypothetical protein ACVBEJ_01800 [Porticoccus sp. GXU_MW_L64]
MGMAVDRTEFTGSDCKNFSKKLNRNLTALKHLLGLPVEYSQ